MEEHTSHSFQGHFVVCNWSRKADAVIRELHANVGQDMRPIVVVTDQPEKMPNTTDEQYNAVFTVIGDPVDDAVLMRAGIQTADTAIILADDREEKFADTKSIIIALTVESLQPKVHTVVELLDSRNESHFEYTHVDEIICVDTMSEKLLAQASLSHGVSKVFMRLITASDVENEIYFVPVPEQFIGKSYRELERALLTFEAEEMVLIGLVTKEVKSRRGKTLLNDEGKPLIDSIVTLNPPSKARKGLSTTITNDYRFVEGDEIIVMAYERPSKLNNLKMGA